MNDSLTGPLRSAPHQSAIAAVTGLLVASCSGGLGYRSVVGIDGSLPLPAAATALRIELENGRLDVRPGADGAIDFRGAVRRGADTAEDLVTFEARGIELRLEPDADAPGTWVLRGPTRPPEIASGVLAVEVQLSVPAAMPLAIAVSNSCDIATEGRAAHTSITTHRGDVRCMGTTGAAEIHTGTGVIIVYDHRGDLDVETGMGGIQAFVREPGRRLRLVCGSGDAQCLVPPTVGFRVDARTEQGKMANGFGLPVDRVGYSAAMTGTRGDGRTEIVMRTGSGFLSLSHKTFE